MTKALEQRLHRVYWGRGMPLSKSSQWDTRASMCTHKDKIKLRINWPTNAEYSSRQFNVKSRRGSNSFKKLSEHFARELLQLGEQRADGNQVEATLQFTGSPGTIANILLISAEHISKECLQPEFEVVTLCECI